MLRVNCFRSFAVACFFAAANLASAAAIVNVDIEGYRGSEAQPTTYVGSGAAGGGTVFNSFSTTAYSDGGATTTTGDNQTYSTSGGLLNSTGGLTGVNFTIGPVGVDNENPNAGATTNATSLFDDYTFNHSAGNNTNSNFTISGLTPGATYDVYLYGSILDNTSISGGTLTPFASVGIFNSGNTDLWVAAADALGDINGTMAGTYGSDPQILSGFTVEGATFGQVPEPGSLAALVGLCGMGLAGLVIRRRRAAR